MNDYKIKVGEITKTHGLKGEVKIQSNAAHKDELFKKGQTFKMVRNNQSYKVTVKSFKTLPQGDFITFNEYPDINLILEYIGSSLYAEESELAELNSDEYYKKDLIGIKVYQYDNYKGDVVGIRHYSQCDYLEIAVYDGDKEHIALVPFRHELMHVNFMARRIDIVDMEGLL